MAGITVRNHVTNQTIDTLCVESCHHDDVTTHLRSIANRLEESAEHPLEQIEIKISSQFVVRDNRPSVQLI